MSIKTILYPANMVSDTHISADSVKWFLRQLVHFGLSPEAVFDNTDLDDAFLRNPEAMISTGDYEQVVKNALEKTGDPALGIRIGRYQSLAEYGVWGYAILSCTTAGEAMRIAFRYWELNGGLVNVTAAVKGGSLIWEIRPSFAFNSREVEVFAVEELLSTTYYSCRALFGRPLDIEGLSLTYEKPAHADLYRTFTEAPIRFGQDKNLLMTSTATLNLPTVTGRAEMKPVLEIQCRELLLKLKDADALIETIRRFIIDSPGRFPGAIETADRLGISPRTLFRRLRERGTTYQQILDEVRAELARDYLRQTSLSIDQISELIGFAETTTFRRAFKKWTGLSPTRFKKEHPQI